MNREIKFRAWDKQQKKMREVNALYLDVQMGMAPGDRAILVDLHEMSRAYHVGRDVELMQFTGLVDRHGKEVYEGDIIQRPDVGVPMAVRWNAEMAEFDLTREPDNLKASVIWYPGIMHTDYEIIGNIWENGDLLKADE